MGTLNSYAQNAPINSCFELQTAGGFDLFSCDDQNFLVDPGFECQTPPADGGWILFGGGFSTNYAHTGHWSMFDEGYDSVPGCYEQFPAAPGQKWQLTGYGLTPAPLLGSPAFGLIQVTFFDIFGNNLGTVETAGSGTPAQTSAEVNGTSTPGKWIFLDTGIATAPADTAYIQAFTIYVDYSGYVQGVYFDDLDLRVLAINHGEYVDSIAQNAFDLLEAGDITWDEALDLVIDAAESGDGIPHQTP
jgi:hypothetical protein